MYHLILSLLEYFNISAKKIKCIFCCDTEINFAKCFCIPPPSLREGEPQQALNGVSVLKIDFHVVVTS